MATKQPQNAAGVDYGTLDAFKMLSLAAAKQTKLQFRKNCPFRVEFDKSTFGESASVQWIRSGKMAIGIAMVLETLGTKNVVADKLFIAEQMKRKTGKSYYESIAQDVIAMAVNDLATVGAVPTVIHQLHLTGSEEWFKNSKRVEEFILGFKKSCQYLGAVWAGGETATLKTIVEKEAASLSAAAVGILRDETCFLNGSRIKEGDQIIFVKSSGVHANSITKIREIAEKLPNGYLEEISPEITYGEAVLIPTPLYARLIKELQEDEIDVHYAMNITGHAMRKVLRAPQIFEYEIKELPSPQRIFYIIQGETGYSDEVMYANYNMGLGFVLIVPQKSVEDTLLCAEELGFEAFWAGKVKQTGKKRVTLPNGIVYNAEDLEIR